MKYLNKDQNFINLYNNSINKKNFILNYKLNEDQLKYVKINLINIFNNPDLVYIEELEDACDISIYLDFYPISDIKIAKKILTSKIDFFIKLSIYTMILKFNDRISKNDFFELNNIHLKSTNKFLNFQCKLNLVIYDFVTSEQIIKVLNKQTAPTLFYRFLRLLSENKIVLKKFKPIKITILESIHTRNFNSGVTKELINLFNQVFH